MSPQLTGFSAAHDAAAPNGLATLRAYRYHLLPWCWARARRRLRAPRSFAGGRTRSCSGALGSPGGCDAPTDRPAPRSDPRGPRQRWGGTSAPPPGSTARRPSPRMLRRLPGCQCQLRGDRPARPRVRRNAHDSLAPGASMSILARWCRRRRSPTAVRRRRSRVLRLPADRRSPGAGAPAPDRRSARALRGCCGRASCLHGRRSTAADLQRLDDRDAAPQRLGLRRRHARLPVLRETGTGCSDDQSSATSCSAGSCAPPPTYSSGIDRVRPSNGSEPSIAEPFPGSRSGDRPRYGRRPTPELRFAALRDARRRDPPRDGWLKADATAVVTAGAQKLAELSEDLVEPDRDLPGGVVGPEARAVADVADVVAARGSSTYVRSSGGPKKSSRARDGLEQRDAVATSAAEVVDGAGSRRARRTPSSRCRRRTSGCCRGPACPCSRRSR